MQNHELIISIIPFACGAVAGVAVGIGIAGLFVQDKLARRQKETWAAAMRFYAIREREEADRATGG